MRISSVTIRKDAIKAPVYEQYVVENGCIVLARFKFHHWSAAVPYAATFIRVA